MTPMRRSILVLVVAACSSKSSSQPAPAAIVIDARPVAPPDASAPDASALVVGGDGVARGPLPAQLAPRVAAFLAEPVADDVVVRFAEIARGDDPRANVRWDLHRSGALYFARHSDQPNDQAFDRPLPEKPSLRVDDKHMREIYAAFVAQRFFDHPGFETVPGATGGTTVIVRARPRDGKDLHTVVYDVSRPDLLDFLETITVSL
jgi:hypothetical protein